MAEKLLASSPTLEGIRTMASKYYGGSTVTLVPAAGAADVFEVHAGRGKCSTIVKQKGKRFRLVLPVEG